PRWRLSPAPLDPRSAFRRRAAALRTGKRLEHGRSIYTWRSPRPTARRVLRTRKRGAWHGWQEGRLASQPRPQDEEDAVRSSGAARRPILAAIARRPVFRHFARRPSDNPIAACDFPNPPIAML